MDKPPDFILEPENATARNTNRTAELICHSVAAIGLPPAPHPDPVSMNGTLRRIVDALFDAGLQRTGTTVVARYENDPDPIKTYARITTNLS